MSALDVQHKNEQLRNGFTKRQIAHAISPRIQELILLPTEKCNFRCTYCYEDFEIGAMSKTVQRSVERFVERRVVGLEKLTFAWFGGEPLVAKNVVLRLAAHAKAICMENGVQFSGGMTTNAYLLSTELFQALLELGNDFFQITLDGWQEVHDEVRRRADGMGTFDVIWENLLAMRSVDRRFEICVRIHVRRSNLDNLRTLMREFAHAFRGDPRFRLDFQHLRDMGGAGGKTVTEPVSRTELSEIEYELMTIWAEEVKALANAHGRSIQPRQVAPPSLSAVLERPSNEGESAGSRRVEENAHGEPYICYAARPNSLLIRANGRIGKCTVAFDDDRNDLGYLDENGTIVINNEKLRPWIRALGTLDPTSAGCPMKGMQPFDLPAPLPQGTKRQRTIPILATE